MTKNNTGRDGELREATLKAIKATNLCLKHMEYHGQKYKDCTPQERTLIEVQKIINSKRV